MNPPRSDGSGRWQQYVTVPAALLAPAPASVDLLSAATLPLAALTADQALKRLDLHAGDRLLIIGAAGGVGGMAVQLAVAAGITPAGMVSRTEHEQAALDLGAAVAYSTPMTAGEFEAIFDTAGIFCPGLLRKGGRLVTVSDDPIPTAVEMRAGFASHNYVGHDPERLRELAALVDDGTLKLRVAEHYPLTQIEQAHRRVEARGLLGKIAITM